MHLGGGGREYIYPVLALEFVGWKQKSFVWSFWPSLERQRACRMPEILRSEMGWNAWWAVCFTFKTQTRRLIHALWGQCVQRWYKGRCCYINFCKMVLAAAVWWSSWRREMRCVWACDCIGWGPAMKILVKANISTDCACRKKSIRLKPNKGLGSSDI